MCLAARWDDSAELRRLLEGGADVDARMLHKPDRYDIDVTALHEAVVSGSPSCVALLLAHNPRPSLELARMTVELHQIEHGYAGNPFGRSGSSPRDGGHALWISACKSLNIGVVKAMLESGQVDVHWTDSNGLTALHELVEECLHFNYSDSASSTHPSMAFDSDHERKRLAMVRYLVEEAGADVAAGIEITVLKQAQQPADLFETVIKTLSSRNGQLQMLVACDAAGMELPTFEVHAIKLPHDTAKENGLPLVEQYLRGKFDANGHKAHCKVNRPPGYVEMVYENTDTHASDPANYPLHQKRLAELKLITARNAKLEKGKKEARELQELGLLRRRDDERVVSSYHTHARASRSIHHMPTRSSIFSCLAGPGLYQAISTARCCQSRLQSASLTASSSGLLWIPWRPSARCSMRIAAKFTKSTPLCSASFTWGGSCDATALHGRRA